MECRRIFDIDLFYLVISQKCGTNSLDVSCTKTTSTPRSGGPAKSELVGAFSDSIPLSGTVSVEKEEKSNIQNGLDVHNDNDCERK